MLHERWRVEFDRGSGCRFSVLTEDSLSGRDVIEFEGIFGFDEMLERVAGTLLMEQYGDRKIRRDV